METSQCKCKACQSLCDLTPCMGTPKEILAIIHAGYPNQLVISTGNDPILDFTVVKPRSINRDPTKGTCIFFVNRLCKLHQSGLKPVEGRVALHNKRTPRLLYHHLARAWNTKLGRALVERIRNGLAGTHGL